MYSHVWIIQSNVSGRFLCPDLSMSFNMRLAGFFESEDAAIDTAIHHFHDNFTIYDFYISMWQKLKIESIKSAI